MHRRVFLLSCLVLGILYLEAMSDLSTTNLEGAEPLSGCSLFIGSGFPLENQGDMIPEVLYEQGYVDRDRNSSTVYGLNGRLKVYPGAELNSCSYLSRHTFAWKLGWKQVLLRKGDRTLSLKPGYCNIQSSDVLVSEMSLWSYERDELLSRAWGVELPVLYSINFPASARHPNRKLILNASARAAYTHNKMSLHLEYFSFSTGDVDTMLALGKKDLYTGSASINLQFGNQNFLITPELGLHFMPIEGNKYKGRLAVGISITSLMNWMIFE